MSKISCNVNTCAHNVNGGCTLSHLTVDGRSALSSAGTRCDGFTEADSPKNAVECRCNDTDIGCKACNCKYNRDCRCTASQVGISGCHACDENDTCCDTFVKKQ